MEKKVPLGVRLCNPGNLRTNLKSYWKGQIGSENGFCWFYNNYYGVRAMVYLLEKYYKRGWLDSPLEFVSHYAPESDGNNVKKYAEFVSSAFDDKLHIIHLAILIMQQEIGIKYVDDELMFNASYHCRIFFKKHVESGKVDFETGFSWNYVC